MFDLCHSFQLLICNQHRDDHEMSVGQGIQTEDFIPAVLKGPPWLLVEKWVVFLLFMFLSFFPLIMGTFHFSKLYSKLGWSQPHQIIINSRLEKFKYQIFPSYQILTTVDFWHSMAIVQLQLLIRDTGIHLTTWKKTTDTSLTDYIF